jgi:uncharacterized integral membrane protein
MIEDFDNRQPLFYTKKEPRKSFAMFLKNQNRFYINSLNLIDKKAAILIRINVTIISVFFIFNRQFSEIPNEEIISSILICSSFLSMMFAIFSSRPSTIESKRKRNKEVSPKYSNLSENIFAIGQNPNTKLEDYEKAYHEIVNNQELQIGNQVRTLFILENAIHKSYRKLRISYEIFITGFVLAILIFILTNIKDYN